VRYAQHGEYAMMCHPPFRASMTIVRYRFGDYVLDLPKHELRHQGVAVALPARVFECLCCLIEHRERAVSRDELVQAVFGRLNVSDAQLAQAVLRSRRAIGDDGQEQRSIRTVPRYGFRWLAPVTMEQAGDPVPGDGVVAAPAMVIATGESLPTPDTTDEPSPADAGAGNAVDRRRPRWLLPSAIALMAAVLAVLAWFALDAGNPGAPAAKTRAAAAPRAVMVLPTVVQSGNGDTSWARLGLMDFVGDRLRRGGLPVLSSETVLGVLREQPQSDAPSLRKAARATWIVASKVSRNGNAWDVALQAIDDKGLTQRGSARDADLLEGARLASDRLAAALGARVPPGGGEAPGLAERLQRARAAMLANEIETARGILNQAPELQRAQPRLRYQLARVDFRAGEYARGVATLDALLAGDEVRRDPLFHVQVLNARGAMLIRLDRYREAQRDYDQAIALLAGQAQPLELGVALSGRAVADSLQQDFDQALVDFGLARVQLGNAGDALAVARVDANLGILEVDRGRPAQALPYLAKAADDFASMGAVNELATVRDMRVRAYLDLLQTADALAESDRAWPMLAQLRDPTQRADLVLARAEALLAVGRLREAGRLLAMPEAGQALASEHGRRERLQVELAMRNGAAARATAIADAALRDWPPQADPRRHAWLLLQREQAALAAGLEASATADSTLGDSLPGRLARATTQRARGDQAAADAGYRSALALAEERGIPAEIAAVVVAHAGWLLERGRNDEASALVGRAAPWAGQDFDLAILQARLLQALGQGEQAQAARERAAALAGERQPDPDPVAAPAASPPAS
jgi:DNA-binding winged helix-turn-helix (wHTH) protein/tetratricopeptide (TPR) repeat protein